MIVVRIWEGLGNQLFQYAYARALELRTNQRVYFDIERCFAEKLEGKRIPRKYQLNLFHTKIRAYPDTEKMFFFLKQNNPLEKILCWAAQKRMLPLKFIKEQDVSYKADLNTISGCYYLMGWFQNEAYFKEYREIILHELTPKKKIHVTPKMKAVLDENNTVSMHIRRGDFKEENIMLPISYYKRAADYMKTKINNPVFLVFSDEIQWVKTHLNLGECVIYVSDEEKLEDYEELLLMSKCKHNIIANSTFSWWGAWLNKNENKIVVGPKRWCTCFNIMPSDWIKL